MFWIRHCSEGLLRSGGSGRVTGNRRILAALTLSLAAHGMLALLIGRASHADLAALNMGPAPVQVRLVTAEAFLAERMEAPENRGTEVNEPPAPAEMRADVPTAPDSARLVLREEVPHLQTSAVASLLPRGGSDDRDPATLTKAETPIFSQEELEVQPVPIDPVIPNYPSEEGAASAGGLIKLQLLIDEVGRVTSVDVLESALPEAFGVSATRAFEAVRFRPGLRDGLPVRCRITTSIQFAPTALAQMTTAQPDAQVGQRE